MSVSLKPTSKFKIFELSIRKFQWTSHSPTTQFSFSENKQHTEQYWKGLFPYRAFRCSLVLWMMAAVFDSRPSLSKKIIVVYDGTVF